MQRILYCTDSLMAGGTEQQLIELVTRLDRNHYTPFVLCLYGRRAGRSLHFLEHLQKQHIPVFLLDLGWRPWDKLCGVLAVIRIVWAIRPDFVQCVNYHSNLLNRLARPFLPPTVKLIACIYVEYSPKQLFYERLSSGLCSVLVCNSPHLVSQLSKYVSPQRITLIPTGVDIERFSYPDRPQVTRILLVIGRIAHQKAVHLVVEALGTLKNRQQLPPDVVLWIVGEIEEPAAQQQLVESIRHHQLAERVIQFPATARPESFYHATYITVLTSLWEGFPNVILESLAAGCPVIVSEAANATGIIQHDLNGWIVRTTDIEHLAETLAEALAKPESIRLSMSVACRETVAAFSIMAMVKQYEALYFALGT